MNHLLLIGATLFLTLTGFTYQAQNREWTIVSSNVSFKIKNAGFNVDGKFGALTATIVFDETKSSGNSIDATIDSKTINTGNGTRDGHLKKEEYFGVDKFPKIQMKATLFTKETNGTFKGFFKLKIKDKTKDVVVPFSFTQKDGKGMFKGTFTINRLDYGVGESSMVLSDNATITIEVNVLKK
jgi:polyisoprenoid-binding protein YceI